jgi:hypothetical protein
MCVYNDCKHLLTKLYSFFSESGVDLSSDSMFLPSIGDNIRRKLINLNLRELRESGFTHVILSIPRNQHQVS